MASYRVPTEFLLAILSALTTLHCTFMALTLQALYCHGVRTVLSRRLHCADGMTSKSMSGTVAIRILIQPSKPNQGITTCVILKIVKIRENILSTE